MLSVNDTGLRLLRCGFCASACWANRRVIAMAAMTTRTDRLMDLMNSPCLDGTLSALEGWRELDLAGRDTTGGCAGGGSSRQAGPAAWAMPCSGRATLVLHAMTT